MQNFKKKEITMLNSSTYYLAMYARYIRFANRVLIPNRHPILPETSLFHTAIPPIHTFRSQTHNIYTYIIKVS